MTLRADVATLLGALLASRQDVQDDPSVGEAFRDKLLADCEEAELALARLVDRVAAMETVVSAARAVNDLQGTSVGWDEASAYYHDLDEALRALGEEEEE